MLTGYGVAANVAVACFFFSKESCSRCFQVGSSSFGRGLRSWVLGLRSSFYRHSSASSARNETLNGATFLTLEKHALPLQSRKGALHRPCFSAIHVISFLFSGLEKTLRARCKLCSRYPFRLCLPARQAPRK